MALFQNLGPTELIIIGGILVVFFGARKIAEFGKSAGEATKEIKKIKKEFTGAVEDVKKEPVEEKKEEG